MSGGLLQQRNAATAGLAGPAGPPGDGHTVTYGATPPVSPAVHDEWIDSADGTVYTYINDGTSLQWVELGGHHGS